MELRVVCRCGRPLAEYDVEQHPLALYPRVTRQQLPAPAGAHGERDEYRWRVVCTNDRCGHQLIVKGATLADKTQRALTAGRYRSIPAAKRLQGSKRRDARFALERGDIDRLAPWTAPARTIVELRVGVDL